MADGILTEMHLTQNRMEIIYRFLSKVEELVESVDFMRASRKYLINKKYIRKVIKSNNSIVLSHDGKEYIVKGSKQHIRNLTKFNTE
jgi:DNA-binding LytR/AlgR family response regulator